jgi:hypothetical protein
MLYEAIEVVAAIAIIAIGLVAGAAIILGIKPVKEVVRYFLRRRYGSEPPEQISRDATANAYLTGIVAFFTDLATYTLLRTNQDAWYTTVYMLALYVLIGLLVLSIIIAVVFHLIGKSHFR